MSNIQIFHNPRCSKSRAALALLEERGLEPEVVAYLDNPPSRETLLGLLRMVGGEAAQFVRTTDAKFRDAGLSLASDADAEAVADLLSAHPEVMQRPIVVVGDRAVIARPPENLLELLG